MTVKEDIQRLYTLADVAFGDEFEVQILDSDEIWAALARLAEECGFDPKDFD